MVSAIGAAEAQPFDVGAPKRIDGDAAIRLVNVAAQAGVEQFTMVTALGTGKFGWPASKTTFPYHLHAVRFLDTFGRAFQYIGST